MILFQAKLQFDIIPVVFSSSNTNNTTKNWMVCTKFDTVAFFLVI